MLGSSNPVPSPAAAHSARSELLRRASKAPDSLRGPVGEIIDQASDEAACQRGPFLLHRLLGRRVQAIQVSPPDGLEVQFEGGLALRISDNSEQYESFTISPPGLIV